MTEEAVPVDPCVLAGQLLAEYWQGDLNGDRRAWLEQHLESCADCAELGVLWRQLGELPEAQPDPRQRRRFTAMLDAYQTGRGLRPWRAAWAIWLRPLPIALALVLLLAGFGGGWWVRAYSRPAAQDPAGEIAELRQEVHATRQLVVLSMLRLQSANDRLQGVSYGRNLGETDPQICAALLHSLEYDPSPDVRLAALDALQNSKGGQPGPAVTHGLVEAFEYQSSPLVEVALVDSLLELRPPTARALLGKISTNPVYNPEVRQRAAWGLSQWN